MRYLTSPELRKYFLSYCAAEGHHIIPSSALIPSSEDQTLLFVNAGMVPFKPIFLGLEPAPYPNMASIQRCLRAGGKHNDLDNVGYTARHHTFFEMLGNFSFGGYFKREAIQFAFKFLTQILHIPEERLWITVYHEDKETADIWLNEIKVDEKRFSYCGEADNFWAMGETGPCGPCSEIFYDHGPNVSGGPPGSLEADGDRYIEIWNLVFMQYSRGLDGQLMPLPTPCVDTGMGLERLAAVMQGVVNNYETDLFQPLIKAAAQLMPNLKALASHTLPVIADHIRAIGFLMADGICPHNEGRGYVLRRIIRRALRHGYQAGIREPFLYRLIPSVVSQMGDAYPELGKAESHLTTTLLHEEQHFLQTLHQGLQYFEKVVSNLAQKTLPGHLVFKLYDTYGFPADLTGDLARERGLSWDAIGFQAEMDAQRKRSQAAHGFSAALVPPVDLPGTSSTFSGYRQLHQETRILGLLNESNQWVSELPAGATGSVLLEKTPFYAEAGGQVGDQGALYRSMDSTKPSCFTIIDTQKRNNAYLHIGTVQQSVLKTHEKVYAQVNQKRRQAIARHHSATHLLHAALRELLGADIVQKGSLVTPDYFRFDFQYQPALSDDTIGNIEHRVNRAIWDNLPVTTQQMSLKEAKKTKAIALFNEKYSSEVRVLSMGDFSVELCGGTHVKQTGEIGCFKITFVTSIAAGVKRIESVVGEAAYQWIKQLEQRQNKMAAFLKVSPDQLVARLEKQADLAKKQAHDMSELQQYLCNRYARSLVKKTRNVGKTSLVLGRVPVLITNQVRSVIDQIKSSLPPTGVMILGCQQPGKLSISIGISKQYTTQVNAKDIVTLLAPLIKGKGGGRPDFAQIQSESYEPHTLQVAFKAIKNWLADKMKDT
jgi:alanyl-tRNA synthetase